MQSFSWMAPPGTNFPPLTPSSAAALHSFAVAKAQALVTLATGSPWSLTLDPSVAAAITAKSNFLAGTGDSQTLWDANAAVAALVPFATASSFSGTVLGYLATRAAACCCGAAIGVPATDGNPTGRPASGVMVSDAALNADALGVAANTVACLAEAQAFATTSNDTFASYNDGWFSSSYIVAFYSALSAAGLTEPEPDPWIASMLSNLNALVTAAPAVTAAVPSAPTGLTATAGSGSVALAWNPPLDPDGYRVSATSYRVYRGTTAGGEGMSAVATVTQAVGSGVVTYTNAGLAAGTAFYYKVTGLNTAPAIYDGGGGEGPPSSEVSATPTT